MSLLEDFHASHSPLLVNDPNEGLENLSPIGTDVESRLKLLARSENRFAKQFADKVWKAKKSKKDVF